uniref:Uncharacterized protein n=1 Tax=Moumouvirus sp. 'Monve' TaxID=1128131 RepID=H2ED15_9VIRU|nr:hypothetical protein mv_R83 [Moumouvirus Monve]
MKEIISLKTNNWQNFMMHLNGVCQKYRYTYNIINKYNIDGITYLNISFSESEHSNILNDQYFIFLEELFSKNICFT